MAKPKKPKRRLGRRAWIEHALETLALEGVHCVRIERMARELGVTKGSFYWHFEDRADLLRGELEFWDTEYTNPLMGDALAAGGEPEAELRALMKGIFSRDATRYECAIRVWAAHDEEVAALVSVVDRKRLRFVRSLFELMGFSRAEANARTRLFMHFVVAEPGILLPDHPVRSGQPLERVLAVLFAGAKDPDGTA